MPSGQREDAARARRQADRECDRHEQRPQHRVIVSRKISESGTGGDADRVQHQDPQSAAQRAVAVGKAECHSDDDGGKRRLQFPAHGADDKRRTDIDQKLCAAANLRGIDGQPAGGHCMQPSQHRRALLLSHVGKISE